MKPKYTSSRTIITSILNKITPAVPVWLMGHVWEQRHKDKLPAAACSIPLLGSIYRSRAAWGVEPNIEPLRTCWDGEQDSLAATSVAAYAAM